MTIYAMIQPSTSSHNSPEYSVSEISGALKRVVEDTFGYVRVRGEVSGLKVAASGHAYLTLKDDKAVIDGVCWKGTMGRLPVKPEDGLEVICTGKLTTYPGRSKYQLVIEALEPAGIGALLAQLEERKKKLAAEGLFDEARKQRLPFMPQTIGVITSPTGAVIRDILHRIADRFPCHVLVWPVLVQGEGAAAQVVEAIRGFNSLFDVPPTASPASRPSDLRSPTGGAGGVPSDSAADRVGGSNKNFTPLNPDPCIPNPDLLIIARGGGSLEDLWAFNEEIVARAVAESSIPIISAVGHETDTTLVDYVADVRAPTPTAAAEMAVPVREEWVYATSQRGLQMQRAIQQQLQQRKDRIENLSRGLLSPARLLENAMQRLDEWSERLSTALPKRMAMQRDALTALSTRLHPRGLRTQIANDAQQLATQQSQLNRAVQYKLTRESDRLAAIFRMLESLSHTNVLARGFALAKAADGTLLTSAAAAQKTAPARLTFHDSDINVQPASANNMATKSLCKKKKPANSDEQSSLF